MSYRSPIIGAVGRVEGAQHHQPQRRRRQDNCDSRDGGDPVSRVRQSGLGDRPGSADELDHDADRGAGLEGCEPPGAHFGPDVQGLARPEGDAATFDLDQTLYREASPIGAVRTLELLPSSLDLMSLDQARWNIHAGPGRRSGRSMTTSPTKTWRSRWGKWSPRPWLRRRCARHYRACGTRRQSTAFAALRGGGECLSTSPAS
jgi:hypothetical protein